MQCNFCLHLPTLTPRKGQSLGKFNEWISSFQDIRLAAKFPGLFTGIAIENMLTVLGRYLGLSINLTILDCQLYLKKSVEKTTIKRFHKLFHRQANPASVREKTSEGQSSTEWSFSYICFLMGYHPVSATTPPPQSPSKSSYFDSLLFQQVGLLLMASSSSWIIHSSLSLYHPALHTTHNNTPCCTPRSYTRKSFQSGDGRLYPSPHIWCTDKTTNPQGNSRVVLEMTRSQKSQF